MTVPCCAKSTRPSPRWLLAVVATMLLTPGVRAELILSLPPTPEILRSGDIDFFTHTPDSKKNNRVSIFYATPRLLAAPDDPTQGYGRKYDANLRFGVADLLIGPENLAWTFLHRHTTTAEREDVMDLSLRTVHPVAELTPEDDTAALSAPQRAFIDQINQALEESVLDDLTIFVHGAFNSFYYAAAEAAQYKFFTGKQAVVLLFAWPTIEDHIAYGRNAKRAEGSEQAFNRMLELLARHSKAERINIIGYSVGGRLVGGALAALAEANRGAENLDEVHRSLRLGHLYLTASDEPIAEFFTYADSFTRLFDTVTVTAAAKDPVLGAAQVTGGGARLGRPTIKEGKKGYPSEAERRNVERLINAGALHVLNLGVVDMPGYQFEHGDWYLNPWVSSDVLVTLNLDLHPRKRGLQTMDVKGLALWYFPKDYPQKLHDAVLEYKKARPEGPGVTAP